MESRGAVVAALSSNAAIAVMKGIVGVASGNAAMLSECVHSCIDTADQGLLLFGQKRAEQPADDLHPFGYGQEVYFWSTVVAVLIFALGGGLSILEGLYRLVHPEPLGDPTWTYVVLAGAFCFEGTSLLIGMHKLNKRRHGRSVWRTYREAKDPSLLTVVTEDSAALVGLLFAFLATFFAHLLHAPWLDGLGAICIGLLLVVVSIVLVRETRSLLLGETAGQELVDGIRQIMTREDEVERVGRIFTMYFGPEQILLNVDVEFRGDLTADALAAVTDRLEAQIRERYPKVKNIFVEMQSIQPPRRNRAEPPRPHLH